MTQAVAGAALLTAAAAVGALAPEPLGAVTAAVSLVLFVVGVGAFAWGFAVAVARSRLEAVSVAGLFWLSGVVAPRVRVAFLGSLAVETAGALTASAIRPLPTVALSILAPVHALGLTGLWSARHAAFPRR